MSIFAITVFDVELGNCHVLQIPNLSKDVMMIDAGKRPDFSPALHIKNNWNVQKLRWLTITHQDNDHIEDIDNVKLLNPRTLSRPIVSMEYLENQYGYPLPDNLLKFMEYEQTFTGSALPIGDLSYDWGGVQFATFRLKPNFSPNINNLSIVTFAHFSGWTIVFPGDIETEAWDEHLKSESFRDWLSKTDIFIASHHGRESGYNKIVFDYCKPQVVIFSDKSCESSAPDLYRNDSVYGLQFYSRNANTFDTRKVLTTRKDGAIHIQIDHEGHHKITTSTTNLVTV